MDLTWTRWTPSSLSWMPGREAACIHDGTGEMVAVVFDPYLARPVAACLEAFRNAGGVEDARASLARRLAERLGLEEGPVRDALEWAIRRAGVEVVPDEVRVQIKEHR